MCFRFIVFIVIKVYLKGFIMSEVEETLKRIQNHKGVTGVIVVNQEGIHFKD